MIPQRLNCASSFSQAPAVRCAVGPAGRWRQVPGEPSRPALRWHCVRGGAGAVEPPLGGAVHQGHPPGLLLTTSPSLGGLTVAPSGVSTRDPNSAAARSEGSSPGYGPGGSTGWGRAGAESARSGLGDAVLPGERPAGRGPAEAHLGGAPAPARVRAPQGAGRGRCWAQRGDAGRIRSVPCPGAGIPRLLYLEKAHPHGPG